MSNIGKISSIDMLDTTDSSIRCVIEFKKAISLSLELEELIKKINKFHAYYKDGGVLIKGDIFTQEEFVLELLKKLKMLNLYVTVEKIPYKDYTKYLKYIDKLV